MDWLSRLFEMMPVRGRLDLRCSYGAPWRIDQGPGEANEIPYHAVLAGSAMLDDPAGGRPLQLKAGDILLLPGNPRHVMHDGSGAAPLPARNRASLNFTISENLGSGERLDLLCGHFAIAPPHDRLLRSYLPPRLVVHAGAHAGAEGDGRAARRPRLPDAQRVRGRSPRRPRDAERAVDGDVRAGAAARQRDRRRAARSACAGRSSAPGAGGGRPVQRACARMVAAGACATVQHVACDARPPIPGEARTIGQRSSDRHPHDARSERTEEIVAFDRRGGGGGRISIRSGVPARLQEPHGRHSGAVAQDAGAVRPGRLRKACSYRRCEACGDVGSGSS